MAESRPLPYTAFTTANPRQTNAWEWTGGTRLASMSGVTGSTLPKPSPRLGQNLSGVIVAADFANSYTAPRASSSNGTAIRERRQHSHFTTVRIFQNRKLCVCNREARSDRQSGELIDRIAARTLIGELLFIEAFRHARMPFSWASTGSQRRAALGARFSTPRTGVFSCRSASIRSRFLR